MKCNNEMTSQHNCNVIVLYYDINGKQKLEFWHITQRLSIRVNNDYKIKKKWENASPASSLLLDSINIINVNEQQIERRPIKRMTDERGACGHG